MAGPSRHPSLLSASVCCQLPRLPSGRQDFPETEAIHHLSQHRAECGSVEVEVNFPEQSFLIVKIRAHPAPDKNRWTRLKWFHFFLLLHPPYAE